MMFISNEVKMICKKLIEEAEGGINIFDSYKWGDLWGVLYRSANIFERTYMKHHDVKGNKVRARALVMAACIEGVQGDKKPSMFGEAQVKKEGSKVLY